MDYPAASNQKCRNLMGHIPMLWMIVPTTDEPRSVSGILMLSFGGQQSEQSHQRTGRAIRVCARGRWGPGTQRCSMVWSTDGDFSEGTMGEFFLGTHTRTHVHFL